MIAGQRLSDCATRRTWERSWNTHHPPSHPSHIFRVANQRISRGHRFDRHLAMMESVVKGNSLQDSSDAVGDNAVEDSQEGQQQQQPASEVMTIVTNSPVPSEIVQPVAPSTVVDCPRRLSGSVCVCGSCEAARERLLNRTSINSSIAKRKTTDESADEDHSSKRRATESSPSEREEESTRAVGVSSGSSSVMTEEVRVAKMAGACRTILECIGEDPSREGLLDTPNRWAKALLFMCKGYCQTASEVTNGAVFSENHDEMVVVRNIDVHSLCEHHMVPFTGRVHIGYIPNGQIVGLSKLARIAEVFARRLQVQERLTRQIADAVVETVRPLGVAVVVECTHFCMVMRGVQKTGSVTTTSSVRGCFESNPKTRAEFFSIIHGGVKFC